MITIQKLPRFLSQNSSSLQFQQKQFWNWVNASFNKYDKDRVKEVGPDRAAAEWLLRCGGGVRWTGFQEYNRDYNRLPSGSGNLHIEAIDGSESSIDDSGFEHLNGLKHCKEVKFDHCQYMGDDALAKLAYIKDTLRRLEIIYCSNLTDKGINGLSNLTNLNYLRLFGLDGVKNMNACVDSLKKSLPNCKIDSDQGQKAK